LWVAESGHAPFQHSAQNTSGAEMADAGCAVVIAGLLGACDEPSGSYYAGGGMKLTAQAAGFCVRDMREYPFWARCSETFETMRFNRPERYCAIARPEGARPNKPLHFGRFAGVLASKFCDDPPRGMLIETSA